MDPPFHNIKWSVYCTVFQGAFKLKVRVRDDDTGHSRHDLVDKYVKYISLPAVYDGSEPVIYQKVFRGQRFKTDKTRQVCLLNF